MTTEPKSALVKLGGRISEATSRLFAHPYMQIGVLLSCVAWFALGIGADLLTCALSVLAITLTQMVLNGQYHREIEAHRRDLAMHAKLDELIMATKRARDEMAGIEDLDEDTIQGLKEHVKEAIDARGEAAGNADERANAKAAIDRSIKELKGRTKDEAA